MKLQPTDIPGLWSIPEAPLWVELLEATIDTATIRQQLVMRPSWLVLPSEIEQLWTLQKTELTSIRPSLHKQWPEMSVYIENMCIDAAVVRENFVSLYEEHL